MTMWRRENTRDLVYSDWHRSLHRFVGNLDNDRLGMIDLDEVVYCRTCNRPLALIETKRHPSRGATAKVCARLAGMAGLPAYLVKYRQVTGFIPHTKRPDIDMLWLATLAHDGTPGAFTRITPVEYATWLLGFQINHSCTT